MAQNGQILDPKQELFLSGYMNPKSKTFADAKASALKAGYSESYALNIMHHLPDWLSDRIADEKLVKKAEKFLNKTLDLEAVDEEGKIDNALISNQVKVSSIVLKGLAKDRYAERKEHTGKDGGAILNATLNLNELSNEELYKLLQQAEEPHEENGEEVG